MNILITGNTATIALSLSKELLKEGHSVVITDASDNFSTIKNKNFAVFKMSTSDALYREIYRSHSFDAVFFISSPENNLLDADNPEMSQSNIGLENALNLCQETGVGQFIYISSTEVYGDSEIALEDAQPAPSTKLGQIILNGENLCRFYAKIHTFSISIVRVPYIYGPQEKNSFLYKLIKAAKSQEKVEIKAYGTSHCSFLHIEDLFNFLKSLLEDEKKPGFQIFNLNTEDINFYFLVQLFNYYLPKTIFSFISDSSAEPLKQKIEVKAAKENYSWSPQHQLIEDLPALLQIDMDKPARKITLIEKLKALTISYQPLLVWGEVILGAFLMHMLTIWANTIVEFKYIDYRLLYVILIGSTHGLLFGVLAALLAAVSGAISWYHFGLNWALLVYNIGNWVPFALFFLAGSVTGYVHDKKENEINFEINQTKLIHEKYEFLYNLYNEISSIKDRLREQLVGYRDSFGRFFRIANELNELDEDNIFFKALEVLEDVMKNNQIAIYSIEPTENYGRLEVKSTGFERQIPRSLKLSDFSKALGVLKEGAIFQNTDLLPNYPDYIAPIANQGKLIGLVIIWEADYKQFTMYYLNLFKVITGLIQSSLVRAATFKIAQIEKLYLPSTQIMKPAPFKQSLKIKKKMRRNKILDFQIIRVEKGKRDWNELFEQLSKGIRSDDVAGVLNENDTHCYVLLANAGIENIDFIKNRLRNLGLISEYIEELEIE
ncbi:MAG: NAD-dependent epimerase/dehydratase family protein [Anaerolineaceae bacterium]|nr:NAD-dependent epimerase/dehydratase family protein [Anaerolineaceae bacterium]